jgi:hypothetical protein
MRVTVAAALGVSAQLTCRHAFRAQSVRSGSDTDWVSDWSVAVHPKVERSSARIAGGSQLEEDRLAQLAEPRRPDDACGRCGASIRRHG